MRNYILICPECDSEVSVSLLASEGRVDVVKCNECDTVQSPSEFGISGAERDALIEEVAELKSIMDNIHNMYVTLDTLADSNNVSPAVVKRLRHTQSETKEMLGFIRGEHSYRLKVAEDLLK